MKPMEHKDKLRGALIETISAMSSLNMYPDPIPATDDEPRYLSESDRWVQHCMEHLRAVCELIMAAEAERAQLELHGVVPVK